MHETARPCGVVGGTPSTCRLENYLESGEVCRRCHEEGQACDVGWKAGVRVLVKPMAIPGHPVKLTSADKRHLAKIAWVVLLKAEDATDLLIYKRGKEAIGRDLST